MRLRQRFAAHVLALAMIVSLAGCASGGSAELESDERPVPDGMPVMYEFYTDT